MIIKYKSLFRILITTAIMLVSLASFPGIVLAQDSGEDLIGSADILDGCGEVMFSFNWEFGTPPYLIKMIFGNGDVSGIIPVADTSYIFNYNYLEQGDYEWIALVEDSDGISRTVTEMLILTGPQVTLSSNPFPPLFVVGEDGTVEFTAVVTGGNPTYDWDLDGDGSYGDGTGPTATFEYTEVGKYQPKVLVTDSCGFTDSDTIPVVVADPENACHPTAQKIADGVNSIFPDQADDLYTCDDIYTIFDGDPEGSNTGFGQMWQAYRLAESIELTWEEILDWKLNVGGWGGLLQLNRFSELLDEHSIGDLMALVVSEEFKVSDVRTAVRSVTRFEADFEDALTRIAEGANPGELSQFYKLAGELEADPEVLDGYLANGMTLSELKHAAKFADRVEADWEDIANARTSADSWGDINQAYRLATDEVSAAEILIMGVQEFKKDLREMVHQETKAKNSEEQKSKKEEKNKRTGEKLAEQFSAEFGDVINLLNGECEGDWACVRETLRNRERTQPDGYTEKDQQTAQQIASKYGFSEAEVLAYNTESCNGDWACTRSYFRDQYMSTKETGNKKKK